MSDATYCPCCGDEMDSRCVVCWTCWHASDKLTPGTHVDPSGRPGETFTITAQDVARYEAMRVERLTEAADERYEQARTAVLGLRLGDAIDTGNGVLVVNRRSFIAGTEVADVVAGTAVPEAITLTEDGRSAWVEAWHEEGEDAGDWVRYERWTAEGRVAHGYVHRVSRRLLQAG